MSTDLVPLEHVPALLQRERAALSQISDPLDAVDSERRLAAIAELTRRAGLAVPIQNEATFLRAEALQLLAGLVDAAQERKELRKKGDRDFDKYSQSEYLRAPTLKDLGISPPRLSEGRSLARTGAIEEARTEAAKRPDQPVSMNDILKRAQRRQRDTRIREERTEAETYARGLITDLGDASFRVDHADLRSWRPESVSCVITDPPYITDDAIELHSALADFAVEILPEHGALAVMTWQPILPAVIEAMKRDRLIYRWTAAWTFGTTERTPERKPRVFDGWKPVLIFHKDGWTDDTTYLYDVIVSRDADKDAHAWGQSVNGFRHLVRAFSKPGETVCDPFVGGGTTALAALAEARLFVGCDIDAEAVTTTRERLAA